MTDTDGFWLLDVSDAAVDRPPTPAIDRDAAQGGLGLYLIAQMCSAHGWTVDEERKHVWACAQIAPVPTETAVACGAGPPERSPRSRSAPPEPHGNRPVRSRSWRSGGSTSDSSGPGAPG